MEIIHLWFRNFHPFESCSFDFSGRFQVDLIFSDNNKDINVVIKENRLFPLSFFGNHISNISALIGKNGTGKTRLIDLLTGILKSSSWYSLPDYIVIFFDSIRNEFYLSHNLYEIKEHRMSMQPRKGVAKNTFQFNLPKGYSLSNEWHGKKSQVVYYAPFLDLRNFPIKADSKDYIDVSTDFLLIEDNKSSEDDKGKDILTVHRFKNVERQFSFIKKFKDNINVTDKFPIPNELELYSLESIYDQNWSHNLSHSAQQIRKYFIGDLTADNRGVIMNRIYQLNSELHRLEEKSKRDSPEYQETKLNRIQLFFLYDFANHFFTARNSQNHWLDHDIGVEVDDFDGMNEWDAFSYFLSKQLWTIDQGKSANELLNYLDKLFKTETEKSRKSSNHDDRKIITEEQGSVLSIITAQNKYLRSLPTWEGFHSIPDLLQIDWRNLSSGEKAFLDIFSRMFYAFESVKDRDKDKYSPNVKDDTKWIYLFLDEGEVGFHPDWQREYMNLLVSITPYIFEGMGIQMVITSHSPFVISDIPQQNVIFLNKRREQFSVASQKVDISNTFAANIHTLLADGFFMSNGLIGEFAKNKVQEVIDWLNNPKAEFNHAKVKEIKNLISLIGEPIVRNKLFESLNEKLGLDGELEKVERELERLQAVKKQLIQKQGDA